MSRTIIVLFDLILIALVSIVLFYTFIGSYHLLLPDEGRYAEVAREMLAMHQWIMPTQNGMLFFDKPPLVYWLAAISMHFFGVNELAVRLVPMFFAVFGLLVNYLGVFICFNRRAAYVSTSILLTNILYFGCAHYFNMDLAVAVLIEATLWCAYLGFFVQAPRMKKVMIYFAFIFAALAVLTKGLIGLALPLMVVGVWVVLCNQWRQVKKMPLLTGFVIFFVITLPWYATISIKNHHFFNYFFINQQFDRYVGASFNMQHGVYFYFLIIFASFLPWTFFIPQTLRYCVVTFFKKKSQAKTEFFLLLWFALILLFFSIPKSKLAGYILPAFFPLAVLLGCYLDHYWQKLHLLRTFRWALWCLLVLVIAALLAFVALVIKHNPFVYSSLPYLLILAAILVLASLVTIALRFKKKSFTSIYVTFVVTMLLLMLAVLFGARHYPLHSNEQIVELTKPYIKSNTVIVVFDNYAPDMSFYLQRPLYIARNDWSNPAVLHQDDWRSELLKGIQLGSNSHLLINDQKLKALWLSSPSIIVILPSQALARFAQVVGAHYKVLAKTKDRSVVTKVVVVNPVKKQTP